MPLRLTHREKFALGAITVLLALGLLGLALLS
jgi:hypothetical protein